jgi:lactoylglutathione lyase
MKFRYATLDVADLARTLDFYDQAFGLRPDFAHDSGHCAELATGTTKLAFAAHASTASRGRRPTAAT